MECKPGSFPSSATLRLLPLALGLLTASLTLQAQPRFAPRPPAARLGAESRPLPVEALIEAALVFSDAPADYLTAGKARFGALIDAFAARPRAADPPPGYSGGHTNFHARNRTGAVRGERDGDARVARAGRL